MMRASLVVALLALPAFAHAGQTQLGVKRAVRGAYKAEFGKDVFKANTLHAFELASVKLKGNQYRGTFASTVAARHHTMGAGMPQLAGTYKLVGGKYQIKIDPSSR